MILDRTKKIYVAGHRGLVGSALVRKLKSEGFTISTMSLQELFIGLTEEVPKEWGA